MSDQPSTIQSDDAKPNHYGDPSPAHRHSAGESAVAETAARRSPEVKQEDIGTLQELTVAATAPNLPAKKARSSSRTNRLKRPGPDYRDLLNEVILDVTGNSRIAEDVLPASQIGASYWTSAEKNIFFRKLAVFGPGDLCSLSDAIGTKSQAEVNVYLKLLQDGVAEADATLPQRQICSVADMPAAVDVESKCEEALEAEADELARKVARRDLKAEEERYDGDWLVDAEVAERLEQEIKAASEVKSEERDVNASSDAEVPESDNTERPVFPAASFLRPDAFLQLSQNIFMAGAPGDSQRHYERDDNVEDIDEPALFRTALDDFHNLAVSLTRRLVQATVFQAMTRLRASDAARTKWQPKPEVAKVDVRTTLDVLGMNPGAWSDYWAKLPRKAGLDVYSDSKKYKDGRPGTKTGAKLSHEEVEAELGLSDARARSPDLKHELEDINELSFDSDDFTTVSEDEHDSIFSGEKVEELQETATSMSKIEHDHKTLETSAVPGKSNVKVQSEDRTPRPRKRQRALSPASFAREEDEYLNALDWISSRKEEQQLWQVLGGEVLADPDVDAQALPEKPILKQPEYPSRGNWRDKVQYEASWERFGEAVDDAEFERMEQEGRRGRKRRKLFRESMMHGSFSPGLADDDSVEGDVDGDSFPQDENDTSSSHGEDSASDEEESDEEDDEGEDDEKCTAQ